MSEQVAYDVKVLKAGGLMKQKEPDLFSVRLRVVGGFVTAAQLEKLAETARKYGSGHVHLTTRQGVEIPFVAFKDIERLREDLAEEELEFGACGPRVRTITACQGANCSHGLVDCMAIANVVDARVFGRAGLPHKFKIGITGCPNACIKPLENDLGIQGIILKTFHEKDCNGCGLCVQACPIPGALEVSDDHLIYSEELCVRCGSCIASCPSDAWERTGTGYAVYVGGKMGKRPILGRRLPHEPQTLDELLAIIDKSIEWYAERGEPRERFGDTIERVGFDRLAEDLGA